MGLPRWAALFLAGIVVLVLNSAVIGDSVVYALGVILVVAGVVFFVVDLVGGAR